MSAHVADRADAPVGPAAPIEGMIDGVIRDLRSDAEEKIPVEAFGHRIITSEGSGQSRVHSVPVPAQGVGGNFQRFGARDALRAYFEVDAAHLVVAVLQQLARGGRLDPAIVSGAIADLGVDPGRVAPFTL